MAGMSAAAAPLAAPTTVLGQIERQTSDWRVRLAMVLGANLEGGNAGAGPWGVGDQGHSFGPFQINLPYHPTMTSTSATNPADAVAYMLSSYQSAVAKVSPALWNTNPELAAEQATRMAENPAQDYYTARGTGTVNNAYQTAVKEITTGSVVPQGPYTVLGGGANTTTAGFVDPIPFGLPGGLLPGLPGSGSSNPIVSGVEKAIADTVKAIAAPLARWFTNAFLVVFGVAVLIIALIILSHSDDDAGQAVAGAAAPSSSGDDAPSEKEHEASDTSTEKEHEASDTSTAEKAAIAE